MEHVNKLRLHRGAVSTSHDVAPRHHNLATGMTRRRLRRRFACKCWIAEIAGLHFGVHLNDSKRGCKVHKKTYESFEGYVSRSPFLNGTSGHCPGPPEFAGELQILAPCTAQEAPAFLHKAPKPLRSYMPKVCPAIYLAEQGTS